MFIDTHSHLQLLNEKNISTDDAVTFASENDVKILINVATDLASSRFNYDIVDQYANIFGSVGLHPNDATDSKDDIPEIIKLIAKAKIVAIGEIGLDFYRDQSSKNDQIDVVTQFLDVAVQTQKPVIFHSRNASDETYQLLKKYQDKVKGVMHCFTYDAEFALKMVELGYYISFSGIVTFPKSDDIQDAAKQIPADQLLIETDCPFLSPVPHRGKVNQPGYVKHVAEKIAELRNQTLDEIADITTANAIKLFNLTDFSV